MGDAYVKAIHQFAGRHKIPVVHFKKGDNKEKVALPYLEAAVREHKDCVVLIGIAQEKTPVWRSWPRKGQEKSRHPHMEWARQSAFINHFYFYLWDRSGVAHSGRPTPTHLFPSGFGSTATNGPNDS
jgi:hypothetical protein